MIRNLLLISNSKTRAEPKVFLGYCQPQIRQHFGGVKEVLFVPYAEPSAIDRVVLANQRASRQQLTIPTSIERMDAYTEYMRPRFEEMGYRLTGIHTVKDPLKAVENAEAVYVGGGNTFDLLSALQQRHLIEPLRARIQEGMPYMGVSAGIVIAGMNICTSNDNAKPLQDLDALEAVPFNLKPHYLEKVTVSDEIRARIMEIAPAVVALIDHQGESHKDRIMEFHHHFPYNVVGLREGAMLKVKDDSVTLLGTSGARIFRQQELVNDYEPAEEFSPGDSLDFLCSGKVEKVPSARVANALYLEWLDSLSPFDRMMYVMHY